MFTVKEARPGDALKGIARMNSADMDVLGLSEGQIIEIVGKKVTAARVRTCDEDCAEHVLQIDGLTRENALVSLDDTVNVRPATHHFAGSVTLQPLSARALTDKEGDSAYILSLLEGQPLTAGDRVRLNLFGTRICDFLVSETTPGGTVVVSKSTYLNRLKPAKVAQPRKISYEDIGGLGFQIRRVREMIELPLRFPQVFERLGIQPPKGVLLYGPPGTGKTVIARAVANETDAWFTHISGPEIIGKFYGESEERLRNIFEEAQSRSPSIIFIDEIDAIGQSRALSMTGNSEQENTLNQLLAEMDGFTPNTGVVIMAATNRPEILDQALLRPGRFDRQIQVVLPTEEGRRDILQIHTREVPLDDNVDLKALAKVTPGFSGADLANIANEAALMAVRRKAEKVSAQDFDLAVERVVAGLQRRTPLTPAVRRRVAYHETGHALAACFLPGTDPVHRVSIIPTARGALGYTMQMPTEDQYIVGEAELQSRLAVLLGGRAAELLIFEEPSTGASNDLERATETARRMVTEFGMSSRLGPVRYAGRAMTYLHSEAESRTDLGSSTFEAIDEEIRRLVSKAQETAVELLKAHEATLHEAARVLQEKEAITGDEIREIIRRVEGSVPAEEKSADASLGGR